MDRLIYKLKILIIILIPCSLIFAVISFIENKQVIELKDVLQKEAIEEELLTFDFYYFTNDDQLSERLEISSTSILSKIVNLFTYNDWGQYYKSARLYDENLVIRISDINGVKYTFQLYKDKEMSFIHMKYKYYNSGTGDSWNFTYKEHTLYDLFKDMVSE